MIDKIEELLDDMEKDPRTGLGNPHPLLLSQPVRADAAFQLR
jgi:Txe/YoeB family toxin of Txe-Axe toxin-antitoxin module